MHLVTHGGGKLLNDIRVGNIFALGDTRHIEMTFDQPYHQLSVAFAETVGLAENSGIDCAQLRMITATALANVVIQASNVEQLALGQTAGNATGDGELFLVTRQHKPPHVLDDFQSVRINGVNMKQIMLHLPYDSAKFRQILAKNAVAVHAPQYPTQFVGGFQQLDK